MDTKPCGFGPASLIIIRYLSSTAHEVHKEMVPTLTEGVQSHSMLMNCRAPEFKQGRVGVEEAVDYFQEVQDCYQERIRMLHSRWIYSGQTRPPRTDREGEEDADQGRREAGMRGMQEAISDSSPFFL
ncbi:unnamed protein product [Pleuronectes platessa]|uniref:Uncharacterized protein n=1 Tax=Pleuronectes platessa TaxID=8262 RepID=A0A9N7W111_PLEPL|nr:unnamed protein product [Pleuronectes platessa]